MIKVEVGQYWRTNPGHTAWKVKGIFNRRGKDYVILSRGSVLKEIQVQHLANGYMMVGSEKEIRHIDDWKRHDWPLADDIDSRSPT